MRTSVHLKKELLPFEELLLANGRNDAIELKFVIAFATKQCIIWYSTSTICSYNKRNTAEKMGKYQRKKRSINKSAKCR